MAEAIQSERKKYSYSIKGVEIPEGPNLTLLQGAAYLGMSYARFCTAVKDGEVPSYRVPGQKRRRVRKSDLDELLASNPV